MTASRPFAGADSCRVNCVGDCFRSSASEGVIGVTDEAGGDAIVGVSSRDASLQPIVIMHRHNTVNRKDCLFFA